MMAETGMSFDPVVDEPLEPLELKKGVSKKEKKKKEVEIDPEVLEQQRLIELKKKDIEEYGVSTNLKNFLSLASMKVFWFLYHIRG
jgi:hypothetical protein